MYIKLYINILIYIKYINLSLKDHCRRGGGKIIPDKQ